MNDSPSYRVLVSDPLAQPGLDLLAKAGLDVDVAIGLSRPELIARIPAYDALIIRSETKVTAEVIAAADRLKVIARAGVGIDNVDVPAATQRGIIVVNAPTGNVVAAAEHAIALLFALARNIPAAHMSMLRGEWNRKDFMGSGAQRQDPRHLGPGSRRRPCRASRHRLGHAGAGL